MSISAMVRPDSAEAGSAQVTDAAGAPGAVGQITRHAAVLAVQVTAVSPVVRVILRRAQVRRI